MRVHMDLASGSADSKLTHNFALLQNPTASRNLGRILSLPLARGGGVVLGGGQFGHQRP